MAKRRVNPNRMELLRLRAQVRTARRGHKLMKDKRDELMRQFLDLVRENAKLRLEVEKLLDEANAEMVIARALLKSEVVETALLSSKGRLELEVGEENTMSVRTPVFKVIKGGKDEKQSGALPYGLTSVGPELDDAVDALQKAFEPMIRLAQTEKKAQRMAAEIERTRRRVNSLEYVMIPELLESIREITMKMDEQERGNLTRLMKVKDMIIEQEIEKKRKIAEASRS
jgi:V/A-type H+-transporting ATPase subunit D